jgi:uridine phosphorylase
MSAPVSDATLHLRPHADVAERVLLPGDPGRALRLAQLLLEGPKMLNHNRGLWGYTGIAADGDPLTVQSTGLGGPSAAIVVEELIALGARRLVRLGTCRALAGGPPLGALLVVTGALARDGASRALGADDVLAPDPLLHAALREAAAGAHSGPVVSTDLFYGPEPAAPGATATDLETAAVLAAAARHGAAAASLLAVTGARAERIDDEGLERAETALGRAGFAALRA